MTVTERSVYLLIILCLVSIMGYEFYWFVQHYEYLMWAYNIVWSRCK